MPNLLFAAAARQRELRLVRAVYRLNISRCISALDGVRFDQTRTAFADPMHRSDGKAQRKFRFRRR